VKLAMDIAPVNQKSIMVSKETDSSIAKEVSLASPLLKQLVAKERRFGNLPKAYIQRYYYMIKVIY
jgi:hypothetical protein